MKLKLFMILSLAALLLPIGVKAEVGPDMKIMFGGNLNLQSVSGGAEVSWLVPLGGRFFGLVQGEENQSDVDEADGYARAYGVNGMIGASLYSNDRWMLALTGGLAAQWYNFAQMGSQATELDTYIQGSFGALGTWRPDDEWEVFINVHYYNPVRDNALSSSFTITGGIALPFGT